MVLNPCLSSAEEIRDLRTWLGGPSPNDIYDDARDKRLEKTCEWILQRQEFLQWQAPSSSSKLLWIKGPAGFGKTILCGKIVEEVERMSAGPVASFFLSSKFEGRDDASSVIRSWLTTLILESQAAYEIVRASRVSQHEQKATQAHILVLLRSVLEEVPGCTFILDGLDECTGMTSTDAEFVPNFLDELRKAVSDTSTRILIMSRGDASIQQGLSKFPNYSEYNIVPEDVGPDLMIYSSQLVNTRLSNKDEPTKLFIANKMKDRCEGQFQWIKLQERSLRKGRNRKQLEREIDETPPGLDSLYDREWKRINSMGFADRERALSLLRWVAFSTRPLNVFEISEAILVTDSCEDILITDDCEGLPVDEMPDSFDDDYVESMILNLCGSLLETRYPSKSDRLPMGVASSEPTEDEGRLDINQDSDSVGFQEVHLTHFSVKEYLLSINLFNIPPSLISNENLRVSNERFGNIALAKSCLRYISLPGAWNNWREDRQDESVTRLLSYAANSWPVHYKRVNTTDKELKDAINNLFEGRTRNFDSWRDWHDLALIELPGRAEDRHRKVNPFHIAISLGLEELVADQIRKDKDVLNMRSSSNAAALHFLCFSPSKSLAELLINNGAELDPLVGSGVTPLSLTLAWGDKELAEILLARGASVTLANRFGKTPLHIVAEQGNVDLARQILDKGADLSVTTSSGYTPLLCAAWGGHCEMVKLLLERGANHLDSVGGYTAVGLAAWHNNISVVQVFIDHGADMEATKEPSRVPSLLSITALQGHTELAELVIEKGVAIDAMSYGDSGHTPLHLASSQGHYATVELLLRRGADINAVSEDLETPLYTAANNGQHDIVDLLLQNGANGNARSRDGYTPLEVAMHNNHLETVDTLLKKSGPDVSTSDGLYIPLHVAALEGSTQMVKLLLSSGVDATEKDLAGRTGLSWAAERGHTSVVDLLLETDYLHLTFVDNCQRTPLHYACAGGHLEIVSMILSRSPEASLMIDGRDYWGSTPLSIAARQGHAEVVNILLDTKLVDINSSDDLGRTVTWWTEHYDISGALTGEEDDQADLRMKGDEDRERYASLCCDICTLPTFDETSYQCRSCHDGDFDICADCFDRGGWCFDRTHILT
jgi:ankyrin repeat protein